MALDIGLITGFIAKIFDPLAGLIDDLHLSREEKLEYKYRLQQLQQELTKQALDLEAKQIQASADVIKSEAGGESWMQRNWRPMLMLTIVSIIANNYVILPYMQLFGLDAVTLELPSELYALMTIGVGGYIGSRGFEKITKTKALSSVLENSKNNQENIKIKPGP